MTRGSPAWRRPSRRTCRTQRRRSSTSGARMAACSGTWSSRRTPPARCGSLGALRGSSRHHSRERSERWARSSRFLPDSDNADCVVLSHVMEHVHEVREGIASARRLLGAGGSDICRGTGRDPLHGLPDRSVPGLQHGAHQSFRSCLFAAPALDRALRGARPSSARSISAAAGIPYPAVYAIGRLGNAGR